MSVRKTINADLSMFLISITALIIIGLIFIYSSSSVFALEKFGSAHYFVKKQCFGLILGLCALMVARFLPLNIIKYMSPWFFMLSLALTAATLLPYIGEHIHGSSRWLKIFGFGFQPSELIKISFILYLAYFLSKRIHRASSFAHNFLPFLCILSITSGILLLQPDFGLTVTLTLTACAMLFVAEFQTRNLLYTLIALIPIAITLICWKAYRLKRILTFLNPWADPQGAGFQIIQSLIAIGSGRYSGVGIAHSRQKFFYLPMQHTDFIFSIIAEETGFIGSCFLILLLCIMLYFGYRIAWRMSDPFCVFATFGFVTLMSLQAVINLTVATGLAPTKGIGLPFVSYGNTALICHLVMVGLIMNMVNDPSTKMQDDRKYR
jgi:cell division protein FtsW